ncbi:hypothetical protein QBK99_13300 [Corticibacterium sp. UT-5YL-CI-8]|nr:hypothetical protein [Tianweitania sp. UT-5YL-CI-8]
MKKPRYVITKLHLDEISAVDMPAQAHAVVSIIKRAADHVAQIDPATQLAAVQAWAGVNITKQQKGNTMSNEPQTTETFIKSFREKYRIADDAEATRLAMAEPDFQRLYDAEEAEKLAEQHRRLGVSMS